MEKLLFSDFEKELVLRCAALYAGNPDFSVTTETIEKLTESYAALSVKNEKLDLALCMHIDDLYEQYQESGSMEKVVKEVNRLVETKLSPVSMPWKVSDVFEYEKVKDKLFLRVTNLFDTKKFTAGCPHRDYGEFTLTAHIKMGEIPDGLCSTPVTNKILERYGISEDELFEAAFENAKKLFPAELIQMELDHGFRMYTITNTLRTNGAAALFYPGMIDKLLELVGEDVYVVPSSIHEMMIYPYSIFPDGDKDLKKVLHNANRTLVQKGETLSENVYLITKEERKLVLPDAYTGIVN